jgi:Homeodomain-like domain
MESLDKHHETYAEQDLKNAEKLERPKGVRLQARRVVGIVHTERHLAKGVSVLSTCVTKQTRDMRYSEVKPRWFLGSRRTHDDAVSLERELYCGSTLAILSSYQKEKMSVSDLCRKFRVSRPTGYRWINRYKKSDWRVS